MTYAIAPYGAGLEEPVTFTYLSSGVIELQGSIPVEISIIAGTVEATSTIVASVEQSVTMAGSVEAASQISGSITGTSEVTGTVKATTQIQGNLL